MRRPRTAQYMAWATVVAIIAIVAGFSATNVFPANLDEIATSDAAVVRLQGGGE